MRRFPRLGRGSPLPRVALTLALLLPAAACDVDDLLTVPDPDVADPGLLTDSTALPAFRAAAIGDFSVAYDANGGDNMITYTGMFADELINSETFPTRIEIDRRDIKEDNANLQTVTRNLYRARTSAEEAVRRYQQLSPNNIGLAEVFNLASLSYMMFGENYCSGVPFSRLTPSGEFEYGGQNTTAQIFTLALERADSALAAAQRAVGPTTAERNTQLNLARVLRGRALLNLNRPAEAATAVRDVPTSFSYVIFHSENTTRENNGVFLFNTINRRVSVANNESGEGLDYRDAHTAGDPRTPFFRPASGSGAIGFDRVTPLFHQAKYPNRSAPTPVANGQEARLIEAEAALRAGNFIQMTTILNGLRSGTTGLSPLLVPTSETAARNMLFRERAFWLWLTAHRMGDTRRLVRQYGVNQAVAFPSGQYHKAEQGGQYGADVNFPLSVQERNNPEFATFPTNQSLCLNRSA